MPRYRMRDGTEWWASRDKFIRWSMPYGLWRTAGGREILFDRRYKPLVERHSTGSPSLASPIEWVTDIVHQEWFYDDGTPEPAKYAAAYAALERWQCIEPVMQAIRDQAKAQARARTWR